MNYIKRLQQEKSELEKQVADLERRINEFRCHLELDKFKGPGNDYIQCSDVRRWLDYIHYEVT